MVGSMLILSLKGPQVTVSIDYLFWVDYFLPVSCLGGYKVSCQCSGRQMGEGSSGYYHFIYELLVNFSVLIMVPLPLAVSDDPRLEFFRFNFPRQ